MAQTLAIFQNSAASVATVSWTADDDYNIVNLYATVGGVLTMDPSWTAGLDTSPSATTSFRNELHLNGQMFWENLKIPLSKGSKIFFAFPASKGTAYVLLEQQSAEILAT